MLCPLLLSACGESTPTGYSGSANSDTLKPVAAPPGADEQPPLPGTTGIPKTPDGLPVLSAKGVNTHLFSEKISGDSARIERLENAVQELRNDFDAMSPAIVRLVSIEKDLQNLIGQLDMLTNGGAAAAIPPIEESSLDVAEPVQPADVPLPPASPDSAPAAAPEIAPPPAPEAPANPTPLVPAQEPAASSAPAAAPVMPSTAGVAPSATAAATSQPPASAPSGPVVTGIRVGEHPDKVRIVLDLTGSSGYSADLDNDEKILVIELPDAGWTAASQQELAANPLLASYHTEALGDHGTMLILQLKKASSIAYKAAMGGEGGTAKIVIDLKK